MMLYSMHHVIDPVTWCHIQCIMLQHPSHMMLYPWHHVIALSHMMSSIIAKIIAKNPGQRHYQWTHTSKTNVCTWALQSLVSHKMTEKPLHHACTASTVTGSRITGNGLCSPVLLASIKYVDSSVSIGVRGGTRALATDFSTHLLVHGPDKLVFSCFLFCVQG